MFSDISNSQKTNNKDLVPDVLIDSISPHISFKGLVNLPKTIINTKFQTSETSKKLLKSKKETNLIPKKTFTLENENESENIQAIEEKSNNKSKSKNFTLYITPGKSCQKDSPIILKEQSHLPLYSKELFSPKVTRDRKIQSPKIPKKNLMILTNSPKRIRVARSKSPVTSAYRKILKSRNKKNVNIEKLVKTFLIKDKPNRLSLSFDKESFSLVRLAMRKSLRKLDSPYKRKVENKWAKTLSVNAK